MDTAGFFLPDQVKDIFYNLKSLGLILVYMLTITLVLVSGTVLKQLRMGQM